MIAWRLAPKYAVRFAGTYEQHQLVAHAREAYTIFAPHKRWLEITSANDGKHMIGSLHYVNRALDFRVWNISAKERWAIVRYLNWKYPDENWLDKGDHIHGEFDPV